STCWCAIRVGRFLPLEGYSFSVKKANDSDVFPTHGFRRASLKAKTALGFWTRSKFDACLSMLLRKRSRLLSAALREGQSLVKSAGRNNGPIRFPQSVRPL